MRSSKQNQRYVGTVKGLRTASPETYTISGETNDGNFGIRLFLSHFQQSEYRIGPYNKMVTINRNDKTGKLVGIASCFRN